nr:helix-turn-helix transcriptional regulator [uncultured Aminipila sp.]
MCQPSTRPLANYIKQKRKELKLTQKQLAEKASLAEVTIKKYERGERYPKIEQLIKLSDALETSFGEILSIFDYELSDQLAQKQFDCNVILEFYSTKLKCDVVLSEDEDEYRIKVTAPKKHESKLVSYEERERIIKMFDTFLPKIFKIIESKEE